MRTIVVGAGVSGLTCAARLRDAGLDVTVIEARDRLGGRVWSGDVAGTPVDLGGSWIHGPIDNPLAEWCSEIGLKWRSDGAWGSRLQVHREDGSLLGHPATTSLVAAWADFDPAEATTALGRNIPLSEAVEWYVADRGLDGEPAEAVRYSLSWLEGGLNIGAHPDTISAAGAAYYRQLPGGNVVLDGGYGTLVDRLAEGLDVRLDEPVLAVEHTTGGVIVSTRAGAHRADRVAITVPLGVLRSGTIVFSPSLPPAVARAVERLRMSTTEKVVLRYRERWWPADIRRLVHLTADHGFTAWMDMSAHTGAPTLISFFNPTLGDCPADPAGRMEAALDGLHRMLGTGPKPIAAMMTDWTNDPYSLGSYSHIPLGATAADMRAFAEADGSVVFAGEHTVPEYYGTVHAAFVSGGGAADRILATL
jgi:polyamine oxidase